MTTCEREDGIKNSNLIYASGGKFYQNPTQSEKEW